MNFAGPTIYSLFHNGEARYSQPLMPILTIFGVYFVFSVGEAFKLRRKLNYIENAYSKNEK